MSLSVIQLRRAPVRTALLVVVVAALVFLVEYLATLSATLQAFSTGALAHLPADLIVSARTQHVRTGQHPAPWKPSPELILQGPYRFTRNPMYLGLTLIQLGLGFAVNNLWISAFAPLSLLTVHFIAVLPEEKYLSEKFGDSYTRYLTHVRRYL